MWPVESAYGYVHMLPQLGMCVYVCVRVLGRAYLLRDLTCHGRHRLSDSLLLSVMTLLLSDMRFHSPCTRTRGPQRCHVQPDRGAHEVPGKLARHV